MKVCVNLKYSSLYGGIALVVVQNGISKRQIYSLDSKALRKLENRPFEIFWSKEEEEQQQKKNAWKKPECLMESIM